MTEKKKLKWPPERVYMIHPNEPVVDGWMPSAMLVYRKRTSAKAGKGRSVTEYRPVPKRKPAKKTVLLDGIELPVGTKVMTPDGIRRIKASDWKRPEVSEKPAKKRKVAKRAT